VPAEVARFEIRDDGTRDPGASREKGLAPASPMAQRTQHPADLRIAHGCTLLSDAWRWAAARCRSG
jgi:hypothetical protein